MDINTVTLVGRLAEDVIYYQGSEDKSSRAVARLIVNRPPSTSGGEKRYDAVQVVAWGVNADNLATYTSKGKELGVIGEIRVNNVAPTRAGGEWKNYVEVMVRSVSFGRDSNQAKVMKALQGSEAELTEALAQGDNAQLAALASTPEIKEILKSLISQGVQATAEEFSAQEDKSDEEVVAASPDVTNPFTDS